MSVKAVNYNAGIFYFINDAMFKVGLVISWAAIICTFFTKGIFLKKFSAKEVSLSATSIANLYFI
jgi:hypothetical protein